MRVPGIRQPCFAGAASAIPSSSPSCRPARLSSATARDARAVAVDPGPAGAFGQYKRPQLAGGAADRGLQPAQRGHVVHPRPRAPAGAPPASSTAARPPTGAESGAPVATRHNRAAVQREPAGADRGEPEPAEQATSPGVE